MIRFLKLKEFTKKLTPVTTTEYTTRADDFHTEGLFSETIFGTEGSRQRKETFSYINLNAKVIHPTVLQILKRLNKKVEKFISTENKFILNKVGMFEVDDENGVTGINEFIKMFPKIKWVGGTADRDKFVKLIGLAYKDDTIFIDKLPVIPPDQRPAFKDDSGKWTIDTLNDYYLTIMRRAFQVKSAAGSGTLFDILNFGLQQSVLDHDKYIRGKVSKKHGIIRNDLLSKRVEFSARAVISPGPDLKINQMGVPFRLAVSLFEPFLIHHLLYSGRVDKKVLEKEVKAYTDLDLSVDSIGRVIRAIKSVDDMPKSLYDLFFEATNTSMFGRVIVAKRDPVLHAEEVRGYSPVLIHGSVIQLSTLQVLGHNADFDGDCTFCDISFKKNGKNKVCHIKDLTKVEEFIKTNIDKKKNGIIVTKFKPLNDIFIKAIDQETGKIEYKKIVQYSIHENIEMFKIHDTKNRFKDFWSSYDHSLIIFDESKNEIRKISPRELKNNPKGKYLIKTQNG